MDPKNAVLITYATMTGNSQIAATSLFESLPAQFPGQKFSLKNIRDLDIEEFGSYGRVIFGVSTWEFDLNPDSEDFVKLLKDFKPDLSKSVFGMFGMGDSQFENFCPAVEVVKKSLEAQAAQIHPHIFKIDGFPGNAELKALSLWAKDFLST